jgi:enoyl-CoA hydratase/carnithine racemase
MQAEMNDAFDRGDADDDVRAVIVTGRGRGFCAGADLSMGASTFDAGDAVSCVDREGMPLANGLVNYSAAEISRIKGLRCFRLTASSAI